MLLGREVATALAVRVLIAVLTQTFFQPDEYFQALEPAHHLVFGYGSLTWEWLHPLPIRSILYPALNVPIYWILKVSGLHSVRFWGDWLVVGQFNAETCICLNASIATDSQSPHPTRCTSRSYRYISVQANFQGHWGAICPSRRKCF